MIEHDDNIWRIDIASWTSQWDFFQEEKLTILKYLKTSYKGSLVFE